MPSWPWSQIATNHKLRRQGFLNCRNLWLLPFVTVQNTTSQIDFIVTEGILLSAENVHINIGPFQEGFLVTSIMGFTTDKHTHKHIYQWNNTKMGKNAIVHIHVKSEPGYSPKYPEHVFSVIGLSLCRHGLDHKLWQITNCDGRDSWIVAICDGSKHNLSNRFHSNRGYTPKCRKHVHINIGPFQEGFLGTSIMGLITDILTHKHIYQ